MFLDVVFLLSFSVLFLGIILVYKVPESVSVLRSCVFSFITLLCIGAVIVQIFASIGVKICLISIGLAYLLLGILVWGYILINRKIQKLSISVFEIYAIVFIITSFFVLFLKTFTADINNIYINSDPAIHYSYALRVLNTGEIGSMYFAEVFNGLFLELFSPWVTGVDLYKAFVLADSMANLVNVLMFYVLAASCSKSKLIKLMLPLFCVFYFLGWPFFSYVLGGFVYYGWGVTLFAYIVYLMILLYQSENKVNQVVLISLILLGCYSVLVCYMLFVPILAIVVVIGLYIVGKKNDFVISAQMKIGMGILIICGGIIVISIAYFGYFNGDAGYILTAINRDGWIHKDLYQDFLLFVPAIFYMSWYYIKNKKVNFICISIVGILLYTGVTLIGCVCEVISPYYYYKPYYLLWFFSWLILIDAMDYFLTQDKAIVFIYSFVVLFPMLMTLTGADAWLQEKGIVYDEKANRHYPSLLPILDRNEYFLSGEEFQYEDRNAFLEICNYVNDELAYDEVVLFTNDGCIEKWYESFTQENGIFVKDGDDLNRYLSEVNIGQYFIIHQNSEIYRQNTGLVNIYEYVYENGYYGIIEKK